VVPQFVEQNHFDQIVMDTITNTGIAGLLIGQIGEGVRRQVDSSLLTPKP
jgi:hypothetical protein